MEGSAQEASYVEESARTGRPAPFPLVNLPTFVALGKNVSETRCTGATPRYATPAGLSTFAGGLGYA